MPYLPRFHLWKFLERYPVNIEDVMQSQKSVGLAAPGRAAYAFAESKARHDRIFESPLGLRLQRLVSRITWAKATMGER